MKSEVVTVTGAHYAIPRKQKYAMWRYKLSNGRIIWLRPGDAFVVGLGAQLKVDWLDQENFVIHWPVGDTTYPYSFRLGRWAA